MLGIVINCIDSSPAAAVLLEGFAGIGIHIKSREIAAADIHTEAVTFPEDVAGRVEAHSQRIDLTRLHQLLFLQRVTKACPADAVGDV